MGYCRDWRYLNGGYDSQSSTALGCMKRCQAKFPGTTSFYLKGTQCGCSATKSGACIVKAASGYSSYVIKPPPGKSPGDVDALLVYYQGCLASSQCTKGKYNSGASTTSAGSCIACGAGQVGVNGVLGGCVGLRRWVDPVHTVERNRRSHAQITHGSTGQPPKASPPKPSQAMPYSPNNTCIPPNPHHTYSHPPQRYDTRRAVQDRQFRDQVHTLSHVRRGPLLTRVWQRTRRHLH